MNLQETIRKFALQNAVKYGGKANSGAVIAKVLHEQPELKSRMKELQQEIQQIIKEVNKLGVEKQIAELKKIAPELLEEKPKEERKELKPLEDAKPGRVVMRFEPSPSGPLHIGHAYVISLNSEYCRKYKGKMILRIADTNPSNIYPPSYELIAKDADWVTKGNVAEVITQSENMESYYTYALKLLEMGKAYVCTCTADAFRAMALKEEACPCRNLAIKENVKQWEKMLKKYQEGEAVVRLKTDIHHKNPAMRDFPLLRINEEEHPKQGKKHRIWPLMNFSVAVDDFEEEVTHIIRAKDHADNAKRQEIIQKYIGWPVPKAIFVGRINFIDMEVSCSKTRPLIEQGLYRDWDDIRLPFLAALRRRGYQPEAFIKYALDVGVSLTDKTVSKEEFFKVIDAFNREVIEPTAYRYFFIPDPVEVKIEKAPAREVELDLHPDNKEGGRKFKTKDAFYLAKNDVNQVKEGKLYRLMDCLNFKKQGKKLVFDSQEYEKYKQQGERIMHWLPKDAKLVTVEVLMPDNTIVQGWGEEGLGNLEEGAIVQLERFGFCRLDAKEDDKLVFWYAHK
ncbi:glutamate--tRNA ligase [Candidatus Woesearchaeota archaeon]|nr:glutamate--tRNA ligase [Candidatus Woesearchaeota archaeon]